MTVGSRGGNGGRTGGLGSGLGGRGYSAMRLLNRRFMGFCPWLACSFMPPCFSRTSRYECPPPGGQFFGSSGSAFEPSELSKVDRSRILFWLLWAFSKLHDAVNDTL